MPHTKPDADRPLKERVAFAISQLRPALQADRGDIELVDVTEDGVVQVRLQGACVGCPASNMTLKMGVERILRENVPGVKEVVAVN